MAHVVVLGAGLGGMPMAYELKEEQREQDKVTVVSDQEKYQFVPSNPWLAVNWRKPQDIEVPMVLGAGATGKRMDRRAWPGRGCMLFTLVEREKTGELIEALKGFHGRLQDGEGFRIFSMDAEMHL